MVGRVVRSVTVMVALDGCYLWRCKSERKKTMSANEVSLWKTPCGRYLGFYVMSTDVST